MNKIDSKSLLAILVGIVMFIFSVLGIIDGIQDLSGLSHTKKISSLSDSDLRSGEYIQIDKSEEQVKILEIKHMVNGIFHVGTSCYTMFYLSDKDKIIIVISSDKNFDKISNDKNYQIKGKLCEPDSSAQKDITEQLTKNNCGELCSSIYTYYLDTYTQQRAAIKIVIGSTFVSFVLYLILAALCFDRLVNSSDGTSSVRGVFSNKYQKEGICAIIYSKQLGIIMTILLVISAFLMLTKSYIIW